MSIYRHLMPALLCLTASIPSWAVTQLESMRAAVHPDRTRVVFDLSGPAEYLLIDTGKALSIELVITDTVLQTPVSQELFLGTPVAYLSSDSAAGDLRLSFTLGQPVTAKSFALEPYLSRGDRIVLDLYTVKADPEAEQAQVAAAPSQNEAKPGEQGTIHRERVQRAPPPADDGITFSGTWEHEWAIETGDGDTHKFESLIEPRLDADLGGEARLTAIARLRLDAAGDLGPEENRPDNYSSVNGPWANNEYAGFELRELYLDTRSGDVLWRLGKQQVVWGEADGIKVMDVVNPQSYREFILDDFDDSRIPLWMVNAELLMGDAGSLQFLWIPDTTYHELAEPGTPFEIRSPLLVPRAPAGLPVEQRSPDTPDDPLGDSDAGLRYSAFVAGWDITLNYLYHYQDLPVPYQSLRLEGGQPVGMVAPEYERNHLAGTTLSNVFGAFTLRTELVYNSDTYHVSSDFSRRGIADSAEFSSVLGVDWQWDSRDTLLSAQWFQSHLLDHDSQIARSETEHTLSLLYQRDFDYDTWTLRALGLYSVDRGDRWLNLKVSHMLRENLELWLGGDFFGGDSEGIYGQFSSRDRVLLGLELGF